MLTNDKNLSDVESLLEETSFSPSPAFRTALHHRLQQQLLMPEKKPVSNAPSRTDSPHVNNGRLIRRWGLSLALVFCLALILMAFGVPGVQAQIASILNRFGVQVPFASAGLVISPFTPLAPEKIPPQLIYFASLNQEVDGSSYIELRYFSADEFLVIYETLAQPGDSLPQGDSIQVGNLAAVMETYPGGMVYLAAQAPQPWRQTGNGGGGGGGGAENAGAPPQQLVHGTATKITWVQSGLRIELLTNLPADEALHLSASMQPASQLQKP